MRRYNLKWQEGRRRALRTHGTRAEAVLWKRLRNRQLGGMKWRRQHGIDLYIVDFYCPSARLAVELDGPIHQESSTRHADATRTHHLNTAGIRVLRFPNAAVRYHLDHVLRSILHASGVDLSPSLPSP